MRLLLGCQPGPNRWPSHFRLSGGLVVQVPNHVVEQVATNLSHLTGTGDIRADTRNIGPESGALRRGFLACLGIHRTGCAPRLPGTRGEGLRVGIWVGHGHVVHCWPSGPGRTGTEHLSRWHVHQPGRDVMRRRVVAWPHLRGGHAQDIIERQRRIQVEIRRFAVGGHLPRDRKLDHVVRLGPGRMAPARIGEPRRFRRHAVSLRRPGVDPRHNGRDLVVCQTDVVGEGPVPGIGEPRRHLSRCHFRLDRPRPGAHILVRQERHRRHLIWSMAARAVLKQNRTNPLIVGR